MRAKCALLIAMATSVLFPAGSWAQQPVGVAWASLPKPAGPRVVREESGLLRVEFIDYATPDGLAPAQPGGGRLRDRGYVVFAEWPAVPVNYVINPTNAQGLTEDFIADAISAGAETWDAASSREIFSNTYTIDYAAPYTTYDSRNTLCFVDWGASSLVAAAFIWLAVDPLRVVETDIIFNTYWPWGDGTVDPGVMDVQDIATHELGHALGLADMYAPDWADLTMYGYVWFGDIEKRTLERPDILGLRTARRTTWP